jgi:hypothetical protein
MKLDLSFSLGSAALRAGGGVREETFTATATAAGVVFPGPVLLKRIERLSGSVSGAIRLYDHPYSATLLRHTVTLASGEEEILSDLAFINGLYLVLDTPGETEFVTNGDFAANITGWAAQLGSTLSWNAGRLQGVTAGTSGRATQTVSGLSIGVTYQFSATVVSVSGTAGQSASMRLTSSTDGSSTGQVYQSSTFLPGASGTVTTSFVAAATSITVAALQGTGLTCLFDNISIKELTAVDGTFEFEVAA